MAIAQQLQAESAQQNNTSFSQAVTLGAGSNRLFLVAIVGERTSYAAPNSVTYGGVALSLVTDGSQTAENITGSFAGVHFYVLKEASLPANGSNTLAVTWPGAAVNYCVGWWIFTGVDQGNARDVKTLGQTTTATSITVTLDSGATTDAVVCAAYKNDTAGTVAITISGSGVTEDFDVSLATGGARAAAGTGLPAVVSGTIACVATVSSTTRRILVAVRLAEAPAVVNIDDSTLAFPSIGISGDFTPVINAAYISHTESNIALRDETIDANCSLLLVAVLETDSNGTPRTVELDGNALTVVTPINNFVQLHYMLNPPTGTFQLGVDGTGISAIIAAQYAGIDSFESGQQASVDSANYSPSAAALIVHAISAVATGTEPVAGTIERHDEAGEWFGDRIVSGAGTYNVGTTGTTDPDYAGAIFLAQAGEEEEVSFSPSTLALTTLTVNGSFSPVVTLTGTLEFLDATVSGGFTLAVALSGDLELTALALSGGFDPLVTLSGDLSLPVATLSGSFAPAVTLSGALDVATLALSGGFAAAVMLDGALTLPALALSGSVSPVVALDGALDLAQLELGGSFAPAVEFTGELDFPVLLVSGSFPVDNGEVNFEPVSLNVGSLQLSGSFAVSVQVDGSIELTELSLSGAFEPVVSFSGDFDLSALQVAGSFSPLVQFSGDFDVASLELSGLFEPVSLEVTFTGNIALTTVTLSGPFAPVVGVGDSTVQLQPPSLSGFFAPVVSLSGDLTLTTVLLSGSFSLAGSAGIPGTQSVLTAVLPLQVTRSGLPAQALSATRPAQATGARLPAQRAAASLPHQPTKAKP